jgi:hypothetical protein
LRSSRHWKAGCGGRCPAQGPEALLLANGFAGVALVVWPLLAPLSAGLVEPDPARRRLVWWLAALGLGFALYSAADIAAHPYHAVQSFKSLCYINNSPYPRAALPLYCAATCGGFLLSSSAPLRLFGAVALAGLAVSLLTFFTALVSVWCFFAAAASMILVAHFRWRSYDRCAASR